MADLSLPPNNIEAEEAVLGSLLIDPFVFSEIDKIIKTPSAFYVHKNGWIYKAIGDIIRRHESVDLLTVSADLAGKRLLDEIGGEGYLAQLVNTVPTAMNVATYAKIVADRAIDRRMLAATSEIARIAYDGSIGPDQKRAKTKAAIAEAFEGTERRERVNWQESVDLSLEKLYEDIWGERPAEIFTTGISELDKVLDESLFLGKMWIIAAKPKRGKSTLMRSIALANAKAGKPVCIFSHEEKEMNIVKTMLAREALSTVSTMSLRRMVHQEGRDEEAGAIFKRLLKAGDDLKRLPVELVYASGMTAEDEVMEMERLRDTCGTRLFVVDYAQRMRPTDARADRRLQLAHIGQAIANAAHDLDVTILLGSQVNDEGRTREAEDLENEMDVKILIEADESAVSIAQQGKSVPVTLKVMLNRNGPSGDVPALYNGAHRLFTAADIVSLGSAFK